MNPLIIIVIAITIEALVEYVKNLMEKDKRTIAIQLSAAVVSILICFVADVDIYAMLGVSLPLIGVVLTGIFVSRGTNYISDFIGRLRNGGGMWQAKELNFYEKPPDQTHP